MLINQDSTATNSSAVMPVATACSNCGLEERRLIHHVRHRGAFRRLCTNCVLRLHPQSFCPTCFQVDPAPPSNDAVVTCFKCYSASHLRCVESGPNAPPNPYTCPLCLHPNTPLFKLRSRKEGSCDFKAIDRDAAKKLLTAAKIASVSMNKAAVAAKAEAERRGKEAAYARKRAKEALEHVTHLITKEEERNRELAVARPADVTGAGFSGIPNNGGYSRPAVNAGPSTSTSTNINRNGNGNGNANVALSNVLEKPKSAGCGETENSSQVLAAMNAVELREYEKLGGDNTAPMDVDEKGGGLDAGGTSDAVNLSDKQTPEEEIEDVGNEAPLVHYNHSSNGGELPPNHASL